MAYLSSSGQDPAGEVVPAEDIPAQTIPEARPDVSPNTPRRGSVGWSVAVALAGWVLLSPAALVYGGFWVMAVAMGSGGAGSSDPGYDLLALAMVASAVGAPLLMGFALHRRSRTLWILGALGAIPALSGGIYVVTA